MKFIYARRARPGRRHCFTDRFSLRHHFPGRRDGSFPGLRPERDRDGPDLCEAEQSALARRYVLTADLDADEPWSHAGPRSVSPFAPCAASRLAHVFAAARLDERSVLWDLGCGDGRVLLEACARYGCRCVGVEIDAECLERCERSAEAMGPEVASRCSWHLADMTAMPPSALGAPSAEAFGKRAADARENAPTDTAARALAPSSPPPPPPPPPTTVLIFITGRGLCEISGWLKREAGPARPRRRRRRHVRGVPRRVRGLHPGVEFHRRRGFEPASVGRVPRPRTRAIRRVPRPAQGRDFGPVASRRDAPRGVRRVPRRRPPVRDRARRRWTRRTCERSKTWREKSWGRIRRMPLATVVSPGTSPGIPGIRASVFPGTTWTFRGRRGRRRGARDGSGARRARGHRRGRGRERRLVRGGGRRAREPLAPRRAPPLE